MSRLPLLTAAALLVLAGCTSSSDDDKSAGGSDKGSSTGSPSRTASTPAPKGPACADVWKAGATLPADYDTCVTDGAYGQQDVTKCKDGTRLVAFEDAYFAITGGPISKPDVAPMQDTEDFGIAFGACTGE